MQLAAQDLTPDLPESRSIAFRVAARGETAAGPALSGESFGHNGFTGTSVWIDPRRRRIYTLLTNRIHPVVSDAVDMQSLRHGFHEAAVSHENPA
jgi:CubicO group peptidase (beta-lactamase class C family)